MHEFVQRWMRSGNSMAPQRLAKANFPGMKGYNKHKANKWLLYLDANNLYGWAMSQYLPTGGFRPYQNNDLIDKLSGGKFAETEKLVAILETKD
ncbi:uncharacterized protein LOC109619143 [Rhizophagus clarus]|uniref:Uncharacterized protein LOC109619143 n=1 Tax=Rhizophagus clarus TaxID=94130 RepID=A0A8H3QES6_9GLOM|nr:uncharacterized protein LOC109619143 [Rhizophagus clarus]